MDVLVYSGPGTSVESVKQCTETLRRLLTPHYAITTIGAEALIKEPWAPTCALLCLPGGADLGYCQSLNGAGTRIIKQYVRRGGKLLGFCAGAYFASANIEFEKGHQSLEVTGARELGLFPGLCRGAAFKGFQYNSEAGARACELDVMTKLVDLGAPNYFRCYYNGGGVFVGADHLADQGVDVLARYREELDISPGSGNAAIVGCRTGNGYALLSGTHPEFATRTPEISLHTQQGNVVYSTESETYGSRRLMFMSALLRLLGLKDNGSKGSTGSAQLPLSKLHLSGLKSRDVAMLLRSLNDIGSPGADKGASTIIEAETTTFSLESSGAVESKSLCNNSTDESLVRVKTYEDSQPTDEDTPYFRTAKYFQCLSNFYHHAGNNLSFGSPLLYGELMTSTNSILDRNFKFLQKLPSGFTVVATRQTAARGRGTNAWVSPLGGLVFSMVLRHDIKHTVKAPVVFIQYLAALSIVTSIKSYDVNYDKIPVYIKWPNDVYAKNKFGTLENSNSREDYAKIGGILVNANFAGDLFFLVIGCGINVTNAEPTTSLKILTESMEPPLAAYEHERLLAKIIVAFEVNYARFLKDGFRAFEQEYYRCWLHTNQIVTLENSSHSKARIQGISMDDGMLVVSELDERNMHTGKEFTLQPDGNSFDFFNGLVKRKRNG